MKRLPTDPMAAVERAWQRMPRRHLSTVNVEAGRRTHPTACPECGSGNLAKFATGAWTCLECKKEGQA